MPYTVRSTPVADRQIAGLRAARRKTYDLFEEALARQVCAALGYRLTGDAPLPTLCVKHLRGKDRAVVTFSGHEAWVLLVGPHADGDAGRRCVYSSVRFCRRYAPDAAAYQTTVLRRQSGALGQILDRPADPLGESLP